MTPEQKLEIVSLGGEALIRRETGAASQIHDPLAVEPYYSEVVGASRGIVLGMKSGIDSVHIELEELGLEVPENHYRDLLAAVEERGTAKRGLVSEEEFWNLASQSPATIGETA